MKTDFEVVICGGGLAGLTLARQLALELPALSVAVVDRLARPLPEAAHKVGESSIELATHYLGKVLELEDYFDERHLRKLGLRFFFGDPHGPFAERPEIGTSLFPPVPSYQFDRGRLENDLWQLAGENGTTTFAETIVEDVVLSDDHGRHAVRCRSRNSGERFTLHGRWLIDALGRRRFLQSRLGLQQENGHRASAAWWRIDARLDLADLVPADNRSWHRRNVEDRYFSTNHLIGRGYWAWLIPLSSGATSVGIVTDESIHPIRTYGHSYSAALSWLNRHEPMLCRLLAEHEPLDFHGLKHYSYHTKQLFSHRRWSCIGEAAFFLDPLYSPGAEYIALENEITVELIRRDNRGVLTEASVAAFNHLVLDLLAPISLDFYRNQYSTFGHPQIFAAKLAWDTAIHWAFLMQLFLQGLLRRPEPEIFSLADRYRALNERVQRLFIDWAEAAPPRAPFVPLIDLTRMKFLQLLHLELLTRRSRRQTLDAAWMNLDRFEEMAQILFWQALAESHPEQMPVGRRRPWINVWAISLDPESWEADELFTPLTPSRRLRPMQDSLAGIFGPLTLREWLLAELPFRFMQASRGLLYYTVVRAGISLLFKNRRAFRARRLFVTDGHDVVHIP